MNKTLYYVLLMVIIGMIGMVIWNEVKPAKTYYRPQDVAISDDRVYQKDAEGRIYVKNTAKPVSKKNITTEIEENKDKIPEIVVEGVAKDSLVASITTENEKTIYKNQKEQQELANGGQRYLEEIINYKQKQLEEEQRKKDEEARKNAKKEEEITIDYVGPNDLRKPCGLTASQLEKGLKHKLKGLGPAFIAAERTHGVNAVFLASVAALESDWGRSNYARKRNNLFGYGAYTSNPDHAYYFDSKETAIDFVARKLAQDYLSPNGKFHNGYDLKGVNKKYCTNPQWANLVGNIMKEFY